MKMNRTIIMVLALLISPLADANNPVYSPQEFKKELNNTFLSPKKFINVPTPVLIIIDLKKNKVLTQDETLSLINKNIIKDINKFKSLPKYINQQNDYINTKLNPKIKSELHAYYILFNNPQKHLVKLMNSMLNVEMQPELKVIANSISKLNAKVIFNGNGVHKTFFD